MNRIGRMTFINEFVQNFPIDWLGYIRSPAKNYFQLTNAEHLLNFFFLFACLHRPAGRKNLRYPSANIICPQRIIQPHPVSLVGPDGLPKQNRSVNRNNRNSYFYQSEQILFDM